MKYQSRRYEKAIREAINALLGNRSSVNRMISNTIAEYSHKTLVEDGSRLMNSKLEYFVVEKLLSNHYVQGFFCPYRLVSNGLLFWYEPNHRLKRQSQIKQGMDPFEQPHVKVRNNLFYLVQANEQVQTYQIEAW